MLQTVRTPHTITISRMKDGRPVTTKTRMRKATRSSGSDGLPLKSETTHDGQTTVSTYDFAHADAPADATPLGRR
jgi:hypothetical protein